MKNNCIAKRIAVSILSVSMLVGSISMVNAAVPADGKTDASTTADAGGGAYDKWKEEWEKRKNDWTQISLAPGSDETQLNFAWYSKASEDVPKLKIGKGKAMKDAKEYIAVQTEATLDEKTETEYRSNKVTAVGLEENTTYYYSYQIDGKWSAVKKYKTPSAKKYSFIYVGDPQIGSSNSLKGQDTEEFYNAQSASVANDAFNWNVTLQQAAAKTNYEAGFILSAGDQIQTTKKKSPNKKAWVSEIEYTGYLSSEVLRSIPVATTVGNHDADNPNYLYHFNTPNNSEKGSNGIVGGDYWFTYGNALFFMLNTQDTNVAEHKQFMEEAVAKNPDCTWRIAVLHQDIYGSAEHSNEPEITNLRYTLVPYFEENEVDVVLTGHDHAYSRSQILKGGRKTTDYSDGDPDVADDKYSEQFDKDIETATADSVYVSQGNILDSTTDANEKAYLDYLYAVMDSSAVEEKAKDEAVVVNPEGILYMTAGSSSGSKYYDLVARKQSYIANRWQEDVPTYSVIDMTENSFTINTYRTDTDEKIDTTFTIQKTTAKNDADVSKNLSETTVFGVKDMVYTGKAISQNLIVKDSAGNTLTAGKDYTISYKNNKNTGKATVLLNGMGNYSGSKEITFQIKPVKASIKQLTAAGTKMKLNLKKAEGRVSGYEIVYASKKNFRSAKTVETKKLNCTISNAKKGKTYYVKVRAYKESAGEKIYGAYSKIKRVKIKK